MINLSLKSESDLDSEVKNDLEQIVILYHRGMVLIELVHFTAVVI